MLAEFQKLITACKLEIRGIVHVGGHYGQEYDTYIKCGVNKIIFVEPCSPAFSVLKDRFINDNKVLLFNCALGEKECVAQMNVETANKGMSNSLLKPAKHLEQYPEITFGKTEAVQVHKLDNLSFPRTEYNLLYMDVQGYELNVLKGGVNTLVDVDYIYTEVNRAELYEGCAKVEELDEYLKDFERVYTNWAGKTWGDALYIRREKKKF